MIQRLITVVFIVLAALPAYAAEEAEGGLSPFAGNVGNAVWTLTIFVIVVAVLGKFAWGPILKLLQDREEFIHKAVADAKRDREEAEARLKEYTDKLQAARGEAAAMLQDARRDAERLREEMTQKAKAEAEHHRPQRRAPDSARDRPRAAADPPRSRRPVGDDCLEADSAQSLEGRQREADRRRAHSGRGTRH